MVRKKQPPTPAAVALTPLQRAEANPERANFIVGYWDADATLRVFYRWSASGPVPHPEVQKGPSRHLLNAFRDLAVQSFAEKQEYLDGWNTRMGEFYNELGLAQEKEEDEAAE